MITRLMLPKGSMVSPVTVNPYEAPRDRRALNRMVYLEYKEHHKHITTQHNVSIPAQSYHKFFIPIDGCCGFWYYINDVVWLP